MNEHDLAFLHTSPVHVATFDALVKELAPGLRVRHEVAEDLLADAQTRGADGADLVRRIQSAMRDAAASGASVVVCTCSTIGGAAERTVTNGAFVAARIDRAMADRATRHGPRVLVVAALASTLEPTTMLLRESAMAVGARVDVQTFLVEGAWQHFLRGDREAYLRAIVRGVEAMAAGTDVVVLAQASMAAAVDRMAEVGCEVLASPRLGVEAAIAALQVKSPGF